MDEKYTANEVGNLFGIDMDYVTDVFNKCARTITDVARYAKENDIFTYEVEDIESYVEDGKFEREVAVKFNEFLFDMPPEDQSVTDIMIHSITETAADFLNETKICSAMETVFWGKGNHSNVMVDVDVEDWAAFTPYARDDVWSALYVDGGRTVREMFNDMVITRLCERAYEIADKPSDERARYALEERLDNAVMKAFYDGGKISASEVEQCLTYHGDGSTLDELYEDGITFDDLREIVKKVDGKAHSIDRE